MAYVIGYNVFVTCFFFLYKVIVLIILIAKVNESTWFKKFIRQVHVF